MKYLKVFENFGETNIEEEIEDLFYDFSFDIGIDKLIIKHKIISIGQFKESLDVKFCFREQDPREPVEVYESIKENLRPINDKIEDVWGFKSSGARSTITLLTPGYRKILTLMYYK